MTYCRLLDEKKPLGLAWEISLSKSRGLEPMKITILVPSSILDRATSASLVLHGVREGAWTMVYV